jgi:hypothetical protein
MPRRLRLYLLCLLGLFAFLLVACKRPLQVGDHVLVEWEGQDYPAMILKLEGSSKIRVHYDGYDEVWDETVPRNRVHGLVEGNPPQPEPPAKVRAKALAAAKTNVFKIGDKVRVEWHGQIYSATITAIVGQERYRVHYEGYGSEWDEIVGLARIQPR